jgi:hypothetical protein
MKRILLILLLIACFGTSYKAMAQSITESDYYSFMNSISVSDSKENNIVRAETEYPIADTNIIFHGNRFDVNGKGDSLFTPADVKFIKQQLAKAKTYAWKDGKITKAKLIPAKTFDALFRGGVGIGWDNFQKKYGIHTFYDFSVPLFSVDRSLCAIYKGTHCGGLCGGGEIDVYQNKDGKWVLIRYYSLWIS